MIEKRFNAVTRARLRHWLREVRELDPAITMKDLIAYLKVRREWDHETMAFKNYAAVRKALIRGCVT